MSDSIKATSYCASNALVSSDGNHVELQLQLEGNGACDLRMSGQLLMEFIGALHFVGQQAEAGRDKIAAQGRTTPHPCLPIRETAPIEGVFQPDQMALRVSLRNNCWLDFVLSLECARALRDQLDASLLAAASAQPSTQH